MSEPSWVHKVHGFPHASWEDHLMLLEPSQSEFLFAMARFLGFSFYPLASVKVVRTSCYVLLVLPLVFWVIRPVVVNLSPAFGILVDQFSGLAIMLPYGNLVSRSTNQTVLLFFWFSGLSSGSLVCQQHESILRRRPSKMLEVRSLRKQPTAAPGPRTCT